MVNTEPLTDQERAELIELWAAKFFATKKQRSEVLPRQLDDMLARPAQGIAYVRLFLENLRAGVFNPYPRDGEKHPRQAPAMPAPQTAAPAQPAPSPWPSGGPVSEWGKATGVPHDGSPPPLRREIERTRPRGMAIASAFSQLIDLPIGSDPNWRENLIARSNGEPLAVQVNVAYALCAAPELSGRLKYNLFSHEIEVHGPLPWNQDQGPRTWSDVDQANLVQWLQAVTFMSCNNAIAKGAILSVASKSQYDPLLDFIGGLKWDGVARLGTWTVRLLGCADTRYNRAVGGCFLIGLIARAVHPGCKMDNVPIFYGNEGIGKSTLLEAIVGEKYFTDEIADLGSKDAAIGLRGRWLIEMAELDSLSRVEGKRANAFFSRDTDHFRPPYGVNAIDQPRRCVVSGTTNQAEVFSHATGLRRFWVLHVRKADVAGMLAEREQLLAEAAHYHRQGEPHWLTGDLVTDQRREVQAHRQEDSWLDPVREWIANKNESVRQYGFSAREVLVGALEIRDASKWTRQLEMRGVQVLNDLGYTEKVHTETGNRWRRVQGVQENPN